MTLPRLPLSARTLGLDGLEASTPERVRAAIDTGRRWVDQIQASYRALYGRVERSGLYSVRRYLRAAKELVRDTDAAGTLLEDMRQTIRRSSPEERAHGRREAEDVRQLLE